jgi:hypothetical protein
MDDFEDHYDDGECPVCGGEGVVFDCFDGCCADADFGCDDCTRECECMRSTPSSKRMASPGLQQVLDEALANIPAEGQQT